LPVAEDTLGSRSIQPFSQRREHHGDPARDGVFRQYNGVLRLAVNVMRQAGPRKVRMRSARPCLPSPKRRMDGSVCSCTHTAGWDRQSPRCSRAWGLPGGF
jgi:hypothetical protein